MRYFPFLIGLAGCFLPDARFNLAGESFSTRVAGDFGGWIVLGLLLLAAALTAWYNLKKKPVPAPIPGFTGFYLLGFALFRLWDTFTIYAGSNSGNLAGKMQAIILPGEGLALLTISGAWLLVNGLRQKKP